MAKKANQTVEPSRARRLGVISPGQVTAPVPVVGLVAGDADGIEKERAKARRKTVIPNRSTREIGGWVKAVS